MVEDSLKKNQTYKTELSQLQPAIPKMSYDISASSQVLETNPKRMTELSLWAFLVVDTQN